MAEVTKNALRYCKAQHTSQDTAAKRLEKVEIKDPELRKLAGEPGPALCSVCGRPVSA